nr:K386 [uncultured bacterium]
MPQMVIGLSSTPTKIAVKTNLCHHCSQGVLNINTIVLVMR